MENQTKYTPKYNMFKGLDQINSLSPVCQLKFYKLYLEAMPDLSLKIHILKKLLYRMGNLGAVPYEVFQENLSRITEYEECFLPAKLEFRRVPFEQYTDQVQTVLKKMVNLLGIQGDNCQATFHHRFIMASKDPQMLSSLMLHMVNVLSTEPVLNQAINFPDLRKRITTFKLELLNESK